MLSTVIRCYWKNGVKWCNWCKKWCSNWSSNRPVSSGLLFLCPGAGASCLKIYHFREMRKQQSALPGHYSRATAVPIGNASRSRRRDRGEDHADPEDLQAGDGARAKKNSGDPLPAAVVILFACIQLK